MSMGEMGWRFNWKIKLGGYMILLMFWKLLGLLGRLKRVGEVFLNGRGWVIGVIVVIMLVIEEIVKRMVFVVGLKCVNNKN